ncbi:MAG: glycosyltransferase family 4 protein [Deltaproteobacteria bacterium]|nr:glycosyltransferase family 4 protein [Deltaproteobacteria bacterium]
MAKADACVVLNRESLEYAGSDAKIVYHGVDTERFNYCRDNSRVLDGAGKSNSPVIGIVGRVRPEKGHEVLVDAVMPLRERHPNLKVVFVGACDRKHKAWLRSLEKKAPGLIEWVGEQINIASWYHGISIMALPSFREGFSCTVLEAMASGCVVAVSDISDFDQVVDHGNNGFLFEAGNHRALTGIVGELLDSPHSMSRIGKAASQTISKKFTAEHEARTLAGIYKQLL